MCVFLKKMAIFSILKFLNKKHIIFFNGKTLCEENGFDMGQTLGRFDMVLQKWPKVVKNGVFGPKMAKIGVFGPKMAKIDVFDQN